MIAVRMKHYRLVLFSQPACKPCKKVKEHLASLPDDQRLEIELQPFKTPDGEITPFAKQCGVTLSPTLVVLADSIYCIKEEDEEYCDVTYAPVESVVGGKAIIKQLHVLLQTYTYAIAE